MIYIPRAPSMSVSMEIISSLNVTSPLWMSILPYQKSIAYVRNIVTVGAIGVYRRIYVGTGEYICIYR